MKEFIQIELVRNTPGRPKVNMWLRCQDIHSFGEAAAEHAMDGGVSFVDVGSDGGARYISTETVEEIARKISECERA